MNVREGQVWKDDETGQEVYVDGFDDGHVSFVSMGGTHAYGSDVYTFLRLHTLILDPPLQWT